MKFDMSLRRIADCPEDDDDEDGDGWPRLPRPKASTAAAEASTARDKYERLPNEVRLCCG